ncbi:MAG: hypothetical protein ACYDDF_03625 [Thermoplasmatota archaeon]
MKIRFAWTMVATIVLATLIAHPAAALGTPSCSSSHVFESMASHNPSALDNDGVDSIRVWFNISNSVAETDITSAEVYFSGNNATNYLDTLYTVQATDYTRSTDPGFTNNAITAWNKVAGDGIMNFEFLHTFTSSDNAGSSWSMTFKGFASSTGVTCATTTFTLENYVSTILNQGNGAGSYSSSGAWTSGVAWKGWSAAPGANADSTGFLRFDSGTEDGSVSLSMSSLSCSSQCPVSSSIPASSITIFAGQATTPANVATWTKETVSGGVATFTIPTGNPTWVKYNVAPPAGTSECNSGVTDCYTESITATFSP